MTNKHFDDLPKEVVDFGHNEIDVSEYSDICAKAMLRVDKLSFVSELKSRRKLARRLISLTTSKAYIVKHYKAKESISKQYQRCIEIRLRKDKHVGMVIHYKPKQKGIGYIRFELSPQHIKPNEMKHLICWLARKKRLGYIMFTLLKNAWVTRVDVALDLYGLSTFDYYFGLKRATKGKIHPKDINNGFGGLRLGSYKSYLHIAVYDKLKTNNTMIKAENATVSVDLIPSFDMRFLRIEARIAPQKNRGIMLEQLIQSGKLPNPFEKLSIYSTNIKDKLLKHKGFVAMLDEFTIPEAMSQIEKRYAKDKIRQILQQNRIELFDHKRLWDEQQLSCIALLSILQQPAYWEKEHWRKCIANLKIKGK